MKIISITTIKNEADILESFVRYHLKIMDMMIILNNGSTDKSREILNQLLDEGLPIIVIDDEDKYFEPFEKYNFLLKKAMGEFKADIVCPLDCDEFITCDDGNPRGLIEKIPSNSYYLVKWKTYIPTIHDTHEELFVPKRINYIRDENLETFYKAIITKELFYNFDAYLDIGNHNVSFDDSYKNQINSIIQTELKIAHFPLRSINQTMSKVLVNYPNTLSRKVVKPGVSFHYTIMFDKIKKNSTLDMEDVTEFAKQYSLAKNYKKTDFDDEFINIEYSPMNLNFCEDIKIKYDFYQNPLENVLDNYIYFAKEIHRFKTINAEKENQINSLNTQLNNERNMHKVEINNLSENYNDKLNVVNSANLDHIHKTNKLISNIQYNDVKLKIYEDENSYLKKWYIKHKKFLSPFIYLYIIFHSKLNEIIVNIKLYNSLKNNDCFDLGYYLNKYPDVLDTTVCKLFSAELHYVCFGYAERKIFNPKFTKFSNKKELIKKLK